MTIPNVGYGELMSSLVSNLIPRENTLIFYLPCMVKFVNFEFIFIFRGLKFVGIHVEDKLIKHKIRGLFIYILPWNDFGKINEGGGSPWTKYVLTNIGQVLIECITTIAMQCSQ